MMIHAGVARDSDSSRLLPRAAEAEESAPRSARARDTPPPRRRKASAAAVAAARVASCQRRSTLPHFRTRHHFGAARRRSPPMRRRRCAAARRRAADGDGDAEAATRAAARLPWIAAWPCRAAGRRTPTSWAAERTALACGRARSPSPRLVVAISAARRATPPCNATALLSSLDEHAVSDSRLKTRRRTAWATLPTLRCGGRAADGADGGASAAAPPRTARALG